MSQSCQACRFSSERSENYLREDEPKLICRRFPPGHLQDVPRNDCPDVRTYPRITPVFADGWCGEFKASKGPKA